MRTITTLELNIQQTLSLLSSNFFLSDAIESYQYIDYIDHVSYQDYYDLLDNDEEVLSLKENFQGHAFKVSIMGNLCISHAEQYSCERNDENNLKLDTLSIVELPFFDNFELHYIDQDLLQKFRNQQITTVDFIREIRANNKIIIKNKQGKECQLKRKYFPAHVFTIDYECDSSMLHCRKIKL